MVTADPVGPRNTSGTVVKTATRSSSPSTSAELAGAALTMTGPGCPTTCVAWLKLSVSRLWPTVWGAQTARAADSATAAAVSTPPRTPTLTLPSIVAGRGRRVPHGRDTEDPSPAGRRRDKRIRSVNHHGSNHRGLRTTQAVRPGARARRDDLHRQSRAGHRFRRPEWRGQIHDDARHPRPRRPRRGRGYGQRPPVSPAQAPPPAHGRTARRGCLAAGSQGA